MLHDFIWIVEPPKNHQPGHGAQQKGFAVPSDQRWQHLGSEVEVQTWPIALMENTLGGAYTSAKIIYIYIVDVSRVISSVASCFTQQRYGSMFKKPN